MQSTGRISSPHRLKGGQPPVEHNHPYGVATHPQSRQSARLFLQPSELGPPLTPSPTGECHIPLLVPGWGYTLPCGGVEVGIPIRTRGQTLWYSRYICNLCYYPSFSITSEHMGLVKFPGFCGNAPMFSYICLLHNNSTVCDGRGEGQGAFQIST
jgi:hypothetical protein